MVGAKLATLRAVSTGLSHAVAMEVRSTVEFDDPEVRDPITRFNAKGSCR